MPKISRNLKFFLITFILSLPFWWEVNVFQRKIEDFLFWNGMAENPHLLLAQVVQEEELADLKPIRNWQAENLEIGAKSAISVLLSKEGEEKVLYEKNSQEKLPIASLTKLMTVDIVLENYDPSQIVEVSENAVEEDGDSGNFKIGETFTVKQLLYPLLIESSNDAAAVLTEVIGAEAFTDLMNSETKYLGMQDTHFFNPTGLDSDQENKTNYSTAKDLIKLTSNLLKNQPLVWEISGLYEFNFYSPDNTFHHKLKNTNELLNQAPGIIGGKTGWTPKAQGCLLLVTEAPKNRGEIVSVILGSSDRFEEMKKLINWLNQAYRW